MSLADTMNTLRDRVANALATKPIPEVTAIGLANPLHTRTEVDETFANVTVALTQIVDFHARQSALAAFADVNHAELMTRFMASPQGRNLLVSVLVANPQIVDDRINTIVTERINTIRVKQQNHYFFARMFSWLGMIIGALFGAILGLVTNYYLDAGTVKLTENGREYAVAGIIDTLPGQIGIVALLACVFGAFGAALFGRRRDDSNN